MPPHEYNKFTSEGFFTMRKKNDILAYFVAAFPVCLKLCNALEELSGIIAGSSEQHVELRDSRRTRSARDITPTEHSPGDVDCLRSLSSGVVGDDSINCDQAEYVGLGAIKRIIGSNFGEVKLTHKNRVKPLSAVARSILIRDDFVEINSHQLFMRIVCVMKTEDDLKNYISYELSPRPPAIFAVVLYTTPEENSTNDPRRIVIDSGHLLHALVWQRPATYGQIADAYLEFVQKHDRTSVTVVFDGYNFQYTKSQEHFPRASNMTSAEIMFDMNTYASTRQADFLSNDHNKERLITLLSRHSETAGIEVSNSEGDADTLIVQQWRDNISLNPVDSGWKLAGGFLIPILTSRAPAPESLLRLVSCSCKIDCGYICECRRAGLA
ncbi:hypothetical protein PR048_001248 [Dryococelus australis]|uniref:Uncharacterized protein n=1 Tax=Dryococelus australis TaxID=614101 RepID=A0ABQ9IGU4_9NEOP|nr:hypothetical protein PR048_001248 [Dryococelus australis]